MVVLVGANPSGDTFVVVGTSGSVSGGPTQSNVSGIEAADGPDTATITNAPNMYSGISMGGGDDDVTMTGSTAADLELGGGNNTASLTNSLIHHEISSGSGEDHISLDNSTVHDGIETGGGNDTIEATGTLSHRIGGIDTGDGDDDITLDGVMVNSEFNTGDGDDTVTGSGAQINPEMQTGDGNDTITFTDGSVIANGINAGDGDNTLSFTDTEISGDIETGSGNDHLTFTNTTVHDEVETGHGDDTIIVNGGTFNSGIEAGGGKDIVAITEDTIVYGGIDGGSGQDLFVVPVGTVVYDNNNGTFTVEDGMTYTVDSGNIQLPSGRWISYDDFESMGSSVPCFTAGTLIETPDGPTPVENLSPGDLVLTMDRGPVALEWIGQRKLCALELMARPNLRPVRIPAGALGNGNPSTDLIVSPQHRVLVDSAISERMTGSAQILLPAVKLVGYAGIETVLPADGIHYVHIMCHGHEIVFSNGCATESLYLGRETIKALPQAAKQELAIIFPDIIAASAPVFAQARPFLEKRGKIKSLLKRHGKHHRPLQRHAG